MSATSQGMKFKFGGFLKNLFNKSGSSVTAASEPVSESEAPAAEIAPQPARSTPRVMISPKPVAAPTPGLDLPLQSVLASFPLELRPKIRRPDGGGQTIHVAFDKILSQLSSGMVKLPYGDIRRAAPQVFAPGVESDTVAVALPLSEILPQLNPALLTRRPVQKRVEVPDEIESPFANHGEGLAFVVGNTQPEAPAAAASAAPRARPALAVPPPSEAKLPTRSGGTTTFQRISPKPLPAQHAAVSAELDVPTFQKKTTPPPAAPTPPIAPSPVPMPRMTPAMDDAPVFQRKPATPITPAAPEVHAPIAFSFPPETPAPAPVAIPQPPPEAPVNIAPPAPPRPKDYLANPPVPRSTHPAKPPGPAQTQLGTEVVTVSVPLLSLAEAWPDAVREEIVKFRLVDAKLAMPAELIEASLKRGRVAFPWKTIRSWVRPAQQANPSPNDATELDLPLNVIAPMFLARQKASNKPGRPQIDETIPNLFFGLPKPEPSATPRPADTNYYVWGDTSDNARVDDTDFKRKQGGTDFMSRYATPNEIVSRAAALDGVAGVLIALPDGLMVASRIPPEINGDTLAAFLPQIFSKVSQCTKELRMGDLNNLHFTVGNVPWKIFRVNAIFFAVFGRAGEPLPSMELAGLAAELDRKRTL